MTKEHRALLSGVSGQDGSFLAEYLLSLGYEVFGIVRRNSVSENQDSRLHHLDGKIKTYYGDVNDVYSLARIMKDVQPDEIYNLAAMSHVRVSLDIPHYTVSTNALGVLNMLEAYKEECPGARFYQASSSEMFGNNVEADGSQNENTLMVPVSPYGCAKVFGYNITRHYRRAYGLFISNGILFNHESARRGSNFVTNKVVKTAVEIAMGQKEFLYLGNLDAARDWGHSADYVRAMHMMLNHHEPDDFVVATGVAHTVRDLCEYTFNSLGMDYHDHVRVDEKYYRAEELTYLRGDSTKIRTVLGWTPSYTFESMLEEMIDYWCGKLSTYFHKEEKNE